MLDVPKFLSLGGPVVGLLAVLSLVALTVILVKLWQWWLQRPRPKGVVEQALAHLEKGERSQAVILLQGQPNHRAHVIGQTLRLLDNGVLGLEEVKNEALRLARGAAAGRAAATPSARLSEEEDLVADLPGLVEAAELIGSDQIQSRASLGGNLCNASPAADSVPAMVVNDGRAVIAGPAGRRTIPVASVVTGPGSTSLATDEFLVELVFDRPPPRTADAYLRFIPRTEMDIAVVGAGARLTLDEAGRCQDVSVALGAVAPTVVTVPAAAGILVGHPLTDEALKRVAAEASAVCNPIDDKRGTKAYRRQVAGVLAVRALKLAAERAAGRTGS